MTFRCPACRTRRKGWGLFTQHLRESGHAVCKCMAYHHPHRPGSSCCEQHPFAALNQAKRRGEDQDVLMDVFIETVWDRPFAPAGACPF